MPLLQITHGAVYDPAHGVAGDLRDLWIRDGVVIEPPGDARPDRIIDATGLIVMPGGVDVHSHIAGPAVTAARQQNPGRLPGTIETGRLYAGLGYTTAVDAAVPPSGARQAHLEFADTPTIDKAMLIPLGNNVFALEQMAAREPGVLRDFVAWLLGATRAYGVKVVNPGGIETWKQSVQGPNNLDDPVAGFGVTPRQILTSLARVAADLRLPHGLHVHANHLGIPGNAATTLATMQALDGLPAHLSHVQFHSYGGDGADPGTMTSRVPDLAGYVNSHRGISVDVGQIVFGDATALTGDSPVGAFLHRVTGRRWTLHDVELETGCGIVPIEYKERSFVHALQWAIGLEWFLLVDDPWRIGLTTDHPNGGSFLAYPEIIAWLMSRDLRRSLLDRLPARVRERTTLADLDREYTLSEIAIITRAGPARILGMDRKGHLGVGADGDVTIYSPHADRREMFAVPRYVIKAGQVIVDNGEYRGDVAGRTWHVAPPCDAAIVPVLRRWFERYGSTSLENFSLADAAVT